MQPKLISSYRLNDSQDVILVEPTSTDGGADHGLPLESQDVELIDGDIHPPSKAAVGSETTATMVRLTYLCACIIFIIEEFLLFPSCIIQFFPSFPSDIPIILMILSFRLRQGHQWMNQLAGPKHINGRSGAKSSSRMSTIVKRLNKDSNRRPPGSVFRLFNQILHL